MLALYSDLYLIRLWTVYELAFFLSRHEISRMTVVPVHHAVYVIMFFILVTMSNTLEVLLEHLDNKKVTVLVVEVNMSFIASLIARQWHRERAAIDVRLSNFRVQDCSCSCESDRTTGYSNIAKLM